MKTDAKVIKDSISRDGDRLTTMEVTFHRFVLAELNTHRVFSRNSASSRAIPVGKQLQKFLLDPAYPLAWPAEQKGMQGGGKLEYDDLDRAQALFATIRDYTADAIQEYLAELTEDYGPKAKSHTLHKSLLNRWLEPVMWHTAIISATEWDGFWDQRCSPLAQPELAIAAYAMQEAYERSDPTLLHDGEWHLPYVQSRDWDWAREWLQAHEDLQDAGWNADHVLAQVSSARCARVSYLTQSGVRDPIEDLAMFVRLKNPGDGPPHMSPLEHVATPNPGNKHTVTFGLYDGPVLLKTMTRVVPKLGNFVGWDQLRHRTFGL